MMSMTMVCTGMLLNRCRVLFSFSVFSFRFDWRSQRWVLYYTLCLSLSLSSLALLQSTLFASSYVFLTLHIRVLFRCMPYVYLYTYFLGVGWMDKGESRGRWKEETRTEQQRESDPHAFRSRMRRAAMLSSSARWLIVTVRYDAISHFFSFSLSLFNSMHSSSNFALK